MATTVAFRLPQQLTRSTTSRSTAPLEKLETAPSPAGASLFGSIALLMDTGMSLTRSLHRLADTAQSASDQALFLALVSDLERGYSFVEAARHQTLSFSDRQLAWLEIAEATGDVEQVLPFVYGYEWMTTGARCSIAACCLYLFSLAALTALVLTGPLGMLAICSATLLVALRLRRIGSAPGGPERLQWMMLRIPGIGKVLREGIVAEFSRALALQLQQGAPLVQSLPRAGRVLGTALGDSLGERVTDALLQEGDLTAGLRSTGLFSAKYLSFVRCGEETGALAQIMGELAHRSEVGLHYAAQRLVAVSRMAALIGLAAVLTALVVVPQQAHSRILACRPAFAKGGDCVPPPRTPPCALRSL